MKTALFISLLSILPSWVSCTLDNTEESNTQNDIPQVTKDSLKEYISFFRNDEFIDIQAGGELDTSDHISDCHSLYIQMVTEDPEGLTLPMVDFGIELTCYEDYDEARIPELVHDTLFLPKELNDESWWELDYETKRKSFYKQHSPWPEPLLFNDSTGYIGLPNYHSGFIKFDHIEKVENRRYYCTGTFEFDQRFQGKEEVVQIREGAFALIMNYD